MSEAGEHPHKMAECGCEGGTRHKHAGEECIHEDTGTQHKIHDCGCCA